MDGSGIWSKLHQKYVKAEVNSSVTYLFDQKKHQIAALSNKPTDDNISVDKNFNSKKQNFDAANCNVPNVSNIFHHGRTSLHNVYNTLTLTLINNGHYLSIICIALYKGNNDPSFRVTGFSLFEMVYHTEPPDLFKFHYKDGSKYKRTI